MSQFTSDLVVQVAFLDGAAEECVVVLEDMVDGVVMGTAYRGEAEVAVAYDGIDWAECDLG